MMNGASLKFHHSLRQRSLKLRIHKHTRWSRRNGVDNLWNQKGNRRSPRILENGLHLHTNPILPFFQVWRAIRDVPRLVTKRVSAPHNEYKSNTCVFIVSDFLIMITRNHKGLVLHQYRSVLDPTWNWCQRLNVNIFPHTTTGSSYST